MKEANLVFEKSQETADLPLRIAYNNSNEVYNSNGDFVYCHWHNEYEFILVTHGSMIMEIDAKPLHVSAGDALIINSGEIHSSYCINNSTCCLYGIIFNLEILSSSNLDVCQKKFIEPFLAGQYKFLSLIKCVSGWQTDIIRQMKRIIAAYQQKPFGYELSIKSSLYNILSDIISNNAFVIAPKIINLQQEKLKKFKTAIKYIEDNYHDRIYVNDVAKLVDMSADHFFKFFKRFSGETPISYINRHKVHEAAKMLKYTDLSVLDIALKTGFENISYFIKIFRNHTGFTPSRFRKNQT